MDTPVLFLIFNRPDTTQKVFDAIQKAKPKQLFIAADGPRLGKKDDAELCQKTRDIAKNIDWECEVKTLFREKNLGCKIAVSSAITWFFEHVEEGIILEDDCQPNTSFFQFCSLLLEKYKMDERVGMISGNNFIPKKVLEEIDPEGNAYYFVRPTYIWGWATWRRAWQKYDISMREWPMLRKQKYIYNTFLNRNISLFLNDYFQMGYDGRAKTWDIQWYFSSLVNNMLCIIPPRNLISNIGIVGEHSREKTPLQYMPTETLALDQIKHPAHVALDANIEDIFLNITNVNTFNMRIHMIKVLEFLKLNGIVRVLYHKLNLKI